MTNNTNDDNRTPSEIARAAGCTNCGRSLMNTKEYQIWTDLHNNTTGFVCIPCYESLIKLEREESNNDNDNSDNDISSIELLEYTDTTNRHVRATGKVKNQYIFEDTAKLFAAITNKTIGIDFNQLMTIRAGRDGIRELPLIRNDGDGEFKIAIPVNHELADNEQDIYSYFLMRPLAQVFCKTDARNFQVLLADNTRLNQAVEATEAIWNTVEAHRVESFYNKIRLGTYSDIQRLNKKSFDGRKIDNIIDAVKAIHAKRQELIPKKYADLIEPVQTLLKRVERSDPTATNIITKRIFDIVEQELKKEQQRQQQAQSRKEQREKEQQEKEAPSEQQLPSPEELQAEAEQEQRVPQMLPSTLNAYQSEQQKLQDERDEKLRRAAKKSSRKDAKNQNYSKIDIETEKIDTEDKPSDLNLTSDQLLDKSKEKGEKMIDKLNEKLTQVDQQDGDTQEVSTDFVSIDQELTHDDQIGQSRTEKGYDVVLSRQLRHMFQNMQTKFKNIRSDSSGTMNIKRTIQYLAGDRDAKIYDRNIKQVGINIRFLVDCSSSMGSRINDDDPTTSYYDTKSKMTASKELLITMLEATKGLERYIDLKVLAYGAPHAYACVPEVNRKRIETLGADGSTPTHYGIRQAHNDLRKCKSGQKLIIHLTDGEPNDADAARNAIKAAEKDGIKIFTVLIPDTKKLNHSRYKELEHIFGKGKFEPIFKWSAARRIMTSKVANSINNMLQGY